MKLNQTGMNKEETYQFVNNYLAKDTDPKKNVGTFSQIYMEPEANQLMLESLSKNATGVNTYKKLAEIEQYCLSIIASLWNRPANQNEQAHPEKPIGASTIGSSEACFLGASAMKIKWKQWAIRNELDLSIKPNLIIFCCHHVCWEKFSNLCDVELIKIPMDENHLSLNTEALYDMININTIGVIGILGNTYTGLYDDIKKINDVVERYNKLGNNKVHIHVDAASGGFYEPFINPNYIWDFRLNNVVSINASGHKYGLVYPGVGWIIWRCKSHTPPELTPVIEYLCGSIYTTGVNFTKSASHIIAQYYMFIRLGHSGYREIHLSTLKVANFLSQEISILKIDVNNKHNVFQLISNFKDNKKIPIVSWALNYDFAKTINWSLFDISNALSKKGWSIPVYPLENNMRATIIQRFVCRADMDTKFINEFIYDLKMIIKYLCMNF